MWLFNIKTVKIFSYCDLSSGNYTFFNLPFTILICGWNFGSIKYDYHVFILFIFLLPFLNWHYHFRVFLRIIGPLYMDSFTGPNFYANSLWSRYWFFTLLYRGSYASCNNGHWLFINLSPIIEALKWCFFKIYFTFRTGHASVCYCFISGKRILL